MNALETQKKAYARLILEQGITVQPGQSLAIRAEIVHREFVRLLAEQAYTMGARYVDVTWSDLTVDRIRLTTGQPEHLAYSPDYPAQRGAEQLADGWAIISITGRENPDVFEGIDAAAMQQVQTAAMAKLKDWYTGVMANQIPWTVCAAPTPGWAAKLFPNLPADEAIQRLWAAILSATRADTEDPAAAWQAHIDKLQAVVDYLHKHRVHTLHFLDAEPGPDGEPRTQLTIGLTDRPRWITGSSQAGTGVTFSPNIPTEEAFSTPHRLRTEGWVRTSMPFFTLAQQIENAYFRFERGEVVEFHAERGQAVLEQFFSVPGTRYLGEIALVDVNSPIYQSGILFHDTLFDENAACHIAFGRAYPGGVEGNEAMSAEELAAFGVNDSPLHQDIMFGTPTLQLTGISADGSEVAIMHDGQYVPAIFEGK
ncbi:MAG: aminopeptidase [Caldilineaceae bacterium]|nr:aminopeptidase [Caldilineaceae bacterium]